MLKIDPKQLRIEINAGCAKRDNYLDGLERTIERYVGGKWKPGESGKHASRARSDMVDNPWHEAIAIGLPNIIARLPELKLSTRMPRSMLSEAAALQEMIRYWQGHPSTNMLDTCRQLVTDSFVRYGISLTTMQPMPGWYPGQMDPSGGGKDEKAVDVPWMPAVYRIDPYMHAMDPQAQQWKRARWQAVLIVRDIDDLIDEAEEHKDRGWDTAQLKKLAKGAGMSEVRKVGDIELGRNEMAYWDVHVPEHELKDSPGPSKGFNGTWFSLVAGSVGNEWIRKPRPHYGPQSGPFTLYDQYPVPSSAHGVSSFVVADGPMRDRVAHSAALTKAMMRAKKLGLVGKNQQELADILTRAADGSMHAVDMEEVRNAFMELEVGAFSTTQLQGMQIAMDRSDRALGITDSAKGTHVATGSATQEANAFASYQSRASFTKQRFVESYSQNLYIVMWYLWFGYRAEAGGPQLVRSYLPSDDEEMEESVYVAGEESAVSRFDALRLEIDVDSVTMETREQRLASTAACIDATAAVAAMPPNIDKPRLLDEVYNDFGKPQLEGIYDHEMELAMVAQGAQTQSSGGAQQASTPGFPSLSAKSGRQRRTGAEQGVNRQPLMNGAKKPTPARPNPLQSQG